MTDYYVRSTDGNNADSGLTWALAKATINGALAIAVAGDRVFISQAHSETASSSWTTPSTGLPIQLIVVNDSTQPPTSESSTALLSPGASWLLQGSIHVRGLTIFTGIFNLADSTGDALYENCLFDTYDTTGSNQVRFGSTSTASSGLIEVRNSTFNFLAATQGLLPRIKFVKLVNCNFTGTPLSNLILSGSQMGFNVELDGCNLSNLASAGNIIGSTNTASGRLVLRNCELPAVWTGALCAALPTSYSFRAEMYNCDNTSTNYRLWIQTRAGSIRDETTIVRIDGATDAAVDLSWKMASSANAGKGFTSLESGEIAIWNDVGSGNARTLTLEVLTDGVTLTNADLAFNVQAVDSTASPISSLYSNQHVAANILATPSNLTASSLASWTTTGLSSPIAQKIEFTIVAEQRGWIKAKVVLSKPSTTVYVDPKLVLSDNVSTFQRQYPGGPYFNENVTFTMASLKPLVLSSTGRITVIQPGDVIDPAYVTTDGSITYDIIVDFGSIPVLSKQFSVSLPGLAIDQRVDCSVSGYTPTDVYFDEHEFGVLSWVGKVVTPDTLELIGVSTTPISGQRIVQVTVK